MKRLYEALRENGALCAADNVWFSKTNMHLVQDRVCVLCKERKTPTSRRPLVRLARGLAFANEDLARGTELCFRDANVCALFPGPALHALAQRVPRPDRHNEKMPAHKPILQAAELARDIVADRLGERKCVAHTEEEEEDIAQDAEEAAMDSHAVETNRAAPDSGCAAPSVAVKCAAAYRAVSAAHVCDAEDLESRATSLETRVSSKEGCATPQAAHAKPRTETRDVEFSKPVAEDAKAHAKVVPEGDMLPLPETIVLAEDPKTQQHLRNALDRKGASEATTATMMTTTTASAHAKKVGADAKDDEDLEASASQSLDIVRALWLLEQSRVAAHKICNVVTVYAWEAESHRCRVTYRVSRPTRKGEMLWRYGGVAHWVWKIVLRFGHAHMDALADFVRTASTDDFHEAVTAVNLVREHCPRFSLRTTCACCTGAETLHLHERARSPFPKHVWRACDTEWREGVLSTPKAWPPLLAPTQNSKRRARQRNKTSNLCPTP